MNRCPITYEDCGNELYSRKGLHLLSKQLSKLKLFPYTQIEQLNLAKNLFQKLSIQGVQPKLSLTLDLKNQALVPVQNKGTYILKPQHPDYLHLPENEDLTMKLASLAQIATPIHGLLYSEDMSLSYFIKRFDRGPKNAKYHTEDFGQLLELSRLTKYDISVEKIIKKIEERCGFPSVEKLRFFRRFLFNYLVGNEDMHVKNYSIIVKNNSVELSPAYDFLNSSIVLNTKEESALTLNGKKSNFKKEDFTVYLGRERLGLPEIYIHEELQFFMEIQPKWKELIQRSFLPIDLQERYLQIIQQRSNILFAT